MYTLIFKCSNMNGQKDTNGLVGKPNNSIDNKSYNVLLDDAKQIIETSRQQAYSSINVLMVRRNWYLGKRIVEEELRGESRAEYGAQVIKRLSEDLTKYYGKGFDASNLYKFTQFYKFFPEIFHTVCGKSPEKILRLSVSKF